VWHEREAIKYLGDDSRLHAGGGLIFPPMRKTSSNSESLTGKAFSRFWLHAEFLMVEARRCPSRWAITSPPRPDGPRQQAEAIRYLLASVPYRKQLNFTSTVKSAATPSTACGNFNCGLETDRSPKASSSTLRNVRGTLRSLEQQL